jgi:hypothetical protein
MKTVTSTARAWLPVHCTVRGPVRSRSWARCTAVLTWCSHVQFWSRIPFAAHALILLAQLEMAWLNIMKGWFERDVQSGHFKFCKKYSQPTAMILHVNPAKTFKTLNQGLCVNLENRNLSTAKGKKRPKIIIRDLGSRTWYATMVLYFANFQN